MKNFGKHLSFWEKVERTDSCWYWKPSKTSGKYGCWRINGKKVGAHVASWIMSHGPVPDRKHVLHSCDTPPCVRPSHLFLGTTQDNSMDMVRKGRSMCGSKHPLAKLTETQVRKIRWLINAEVTGSQIAAGFAVSPSTISSIKHRKVWGWMTNTPIGPAITYSTAGSAGTKTYSASNMLTQTKG